MSAELQPVVRSTVRRALRIMTLTFAGVAIAGLLALLVAASLTEIIGSTPGMDRASLVAFGMYALGFAFLAASLVPNIFALSNYNAITSLFQGNRAARKLVAGVVFRGRDHPLDADAKAGARRFAELSSTNLALSIASSVTLCAGSTLVQVAPFLALDPNFLVPLRTGIVGALVVVTITAVIIGLRGIRRAQDYLAANPV